MSNHDLVMKFEKLSKLSKTWNEIFNQSARATPFTSFEWFIALAEHLLKTDPEIMLFAENEKVVGIMPAKIENDTLRFIGDERVTDINDMICLPDYEKVVIEKLAIFIKNHNLRVDLYPLDIEGPLVKLLMHFLDGLVIQEQDFCPLLFLPDSWDVYLNELDGKSRHELRRKLKKVNGATAKEMSPSDINILFSLMVKSDHQKTQFLQPEVCEFFKAIAHAFFEKKWLRLRTTILDGRPIGVIIAFGFKRRVYLFNTGFDSEFSNLSPGIVSIGLDIKSAINEGYRYYDFLRGEEDYKYHLGAKQHYTVRIKR